MVLSALQKGFQTLGFSAHGYTVSDSSYCLKDVEGYIKEINRLKGKYKNDIEIYLGIEEEIFHPVQREDYDYIISSSHYTFKNGKYYSLDGSIDHFKEALKAWDNNAMALAENYFDVLCNYIIKRKPDIIGHFDLITKFDEKCDPVFLGNPEYEKLAEQAIKKALTADCIFEVNTGLMARGYRYSPCPHERLLSIIAKNGGRVALSSDAHNKDKICSHFNETRLLLRDIGFDCVYALYDGEWKKDYL
jgi:histidinol-phosphatase (PHP family)